jgi:xylulokinase
MVPGEALRAKNVNVADYLEQCDGRRAGVVFLPFVYGSGSPDPDPTAKAAILGIRYDTDARDVLKAIVDGISFETMANINHFRARAVRIESIHSTGGASRSAVWLQTKADVTGLPVLSFNSPEGGCLGCALLGALAARKFDSLESGARSMVHATGEYFPNEESVRFYKKKFANYQRVRDAVIELTRESLEENGGNA